VSASIGTVWNQEGSIYGMDPIMAATIYVSSTLMYAGTSQFKTVWLSSLVFIIHTISEFLLAWSANLWPFYVLGIFQIIIMIVVVIIAAAGAYNDARRDNG
jgi:hypothetical protein